VEELSRFGLEHLGTQDMTKRILALNRAIAFRDAGRGDEIPTLLESFEWSATALKCQVAVAVLSGARTDIESLLPKAIAAGEINEEALKNWPLFARLRSEDR